MIGYAEIFIAVETIISSLCREQWAKAFLTQ